MGKPTSAERIKNGVKTKKTEKELQKKRDRYSKSTSKVNKEQLDIKHENGRLWKAKSRMLQKESYNWQKLQGMKLKHTSKTKKRNSETRDNNTPSTNKSSTERVRKHRENKRLIVSVPFKLSRSAQKVLLT